MGGAHDMCMYVCVCVNNDAKMLNRLHQVC